jgi:hypothetical protein
MVFPLVFTHVEYFIWHEGCQVSRVLTDGVILAYSRVKLRAKDGVPSQVVNSYAILIKI